jgi:predicted esterase
MPGACLAYHVAVRLDAWMLCATTCTACPGNWEPASGPETELAAAASTSTLERMDRYGEPPSEHEPAEPALPPATVDAYQSLKIPGYLPAVLYNPRLPGPASLVVASHGAGGIPEAECDYWRALTQGRHIVLCLRGWRINNYAPSGFYYPTHFALERELRAALTALRARPDVQIAPAPHVYAGFSQGAIMGAIMIVDHARSFRRLALIEGGFQYWNVARARRFARNGGERVLFVCGTAWCANGARQTSAWLRRAGVQVRLEYAPGAGHTPDGAVLERARAALPWLLNTDAE